MATNDLQTNLDIIDDFTQRLQVAVIGAEETTAKHEKWVEGTVSETIPTENGPIKTLRGIIAEWEQQSDAIVNAAILGYDSQFQTKLTDFENEFINYLLTIGFEPAIIYQPGITLVRRSQTVAYQGVTYYWGGALPFTTTGVFASEPSWLIAPIVGGIEIPQMSFASGGTIVRKTQSVLGSDGEWYFWTGSFPKVIPASSTLESAGGVGLNKFRLASGTVPLRPLMKIVATAAGFVLNQGSFEYGATITSSSQVLSEFGTGKLWKWDGPVPKIVNANSSPVTSGGVGFNLWNEVTSATGTSGAGITISENPPTGVGSGHRWFCTTDGRTYIRYPDGDSVQWVEESPQNSVADGMEPRIRESLRRSYAMAGYNLVQGSFEAGGVLLNSNDVLVYDANGKAFSGVGPFPQVVAPDTDPSGGGFTDKSSSLSKIVVATVADVMAQTTLVVGQNIEWRGYYAAGDGGGNSGTVVSGPRTVDGGSVFLLSNGLYVEANFSFIEPAKFGVSPTRTSAQNAESVSAMVAYALSNKKKIQNYVSMDYQCDPIVISGAFSDFFTWEAPRANVTHRCPSTTSPAFILQGSRTTAFDMNTFQYCTLSGLRIVSPYCGIFTRWTENLHLNRLLFSGGGIGIMQSANGNLETDIKCRIEQIIFAGCKNAYKGAFPDGIGDEGRVADSVFKDWIALNCGTADGDWVFEFGYLDGSLIDHVETYTDSNNLIKMNGMLLRKPNISHIVNCNIFETVGIGIQITSPRNLCMDETNTIWGVGEGANNPALILSKHGTLEAYGCKIRPRIRNNYGPALQVLSVGGFDFTGIEEYNNCLGSASLSGMQFQGSSGNVMHRSKHDSLGGSWISLDNSDIEVFAPKISRYTSDASRANGGKMTVIPGNRQISVSAPVISKTYDDDVNYNAASGGASVQLPNAALCPGKIIRVSKTDSSANGVAVQPLSGTGQTINGAASRTLSSQYSTETYKSDGTNWIVSSKFP